MADKTIRGPYGSEKGITDANVGTVASGSSVVEYGNGCFHQSIITVASTLPAIVGAGNYGVGTLVYTLPSGALDVKATYMSMALTTAGTTNSADTPDIGIGTTIGTGTEIALGTIGATTENMLTGQTASDCNGTANVKHLATSLLIATAGNHTVYFNAACGWTGADTGCGIAGTIIIEWTFVV